MRRSIFTAGILAAALCLASCAAGVGGIASAGTPAIVASEVGLTAAIHTTETALEAKVQAGGRVTSDEAKSISHRASDAMQALIIGRIAYDATIGPNQPPDVQARVAAARHATDHAFDELQQRLGAFIDPPI